MNGQGTRHKLVILLSVLFVTMASADPELDSIPKAALWKTIRDKQVPGLEMQLSLPKNHYYVGELIIAKLTFINHTNDPYSVLTSTRDRSGRILDVGFVAQGSAGLVPDPKKKETVTIGGGREGICPLGTWSVDIVANQWFTLDQLGSYTIYAWSNRVWKGSSLNLLPKNDLVSDKLQITIEPRPPGIEKRLIDDLYEALADKAPDDQADYDAFFKKLDPVRYLNTDASREVLLRVIDNPIISGTVDTIEEVDSGIMAAPDHPALAKHILEEVKSGKLTPGEQLCGMYATLKIHYTVDIFGIDEYDPAEYAAAKEELRTAAPGQKSSAPGQ